MRALTARELIAKAAACQSCGKPHAYRWAGEDAASWAADDGHRYRPAVDITALDQLRALATGSHLSSWRAPHWKAYP